MLKLYNTLTRNIVDFDPIKRGKVSLYTCGPTVYDHQTIGNLRTYVFYDTLKRVLMSNGFDVDHVMNITDVGHLTSDADEGEDKLEKGAKKAGKSVWEVATVYTEEFRSNLKQLNILPPRFANATDYIKEQISLVQILLDKKFAYQTDQAIYFDISRLDSYGSLTGQRLGDKEVAARSEVIADTNKRHPQDFAVWFFTVGHFKDHTMHWPSPWGVGFPGWHLECSAIVHETLGDPIDLHCGAVDLIGTHHTNEMAQSEAAFGNKLANYWVHGEHLLVDGQRMGKSLGNFYTLKDVVDKKCNPISLRLLYLQAHYRSQMNFTWESLVAAAQNLRELEAWADTVYQPAVSPPITQREFDELIQSMASALNDDLNTPRALALLNTAAGGVRPTPQLLDFIDSSFGLGLSKRHDIDDPIKSLIAERETARARKDWPKADDFRHQLLKKGIDLNDTEQGPVWSRI